MNIVEVQAGNIKQWVADLLKAGKFILLSTISGYQEGENICILYHFLTKDGEQDVKVSIPLSNPKIDSISPVLIGAVLYEREIQDLLGVAFDGIVDGRRLILPEQWPEGVYPLRKEYPATRPEEAK